MTVLPRISVIIPCYRAEKTLRGCVASVLQGAPAALEVLVDNQCAVENVTRFGKSQGYQVTAAAEGEDFRLKLSK